MEYKRLTDKELAEKYKNHYYGDSTKLWDAYIRLAELEDKIESGQLVELPCKVGDTVYAVAYTTQYEIIETTCSAVAIISPNTFDIRPKPSRRTYCIFNTYTSKEQAEERLKELKGE